MRCVRRAALLNQRFGHRLRRGGERGGAQLARLLDVVAARLQRIELHAEAHVRVAERSTNADAAERFVHGAAVPHHQVRNDGANASRDARGAVDEDGGVGATAVLVEELERFAQRIEERRAGVVVKLDAAVLNCIGLRREMRACAVDFKAGSDGQHRRDAARFECSGVTRC